MPINTAVCMHTYPQARPLPPSWAGSRGGSYPGAEQAGTGGLRRQEPGGGGLSSVPRRPQPAPSRAGPGPPWRCGRAPSAHARPRLPPLRRRKRLGLSGGLRQPRCPPPLPSSLPSFPEPQPGMRGPARCCRGPWAAERHGALRGAAVAAAAAEALGARRRPGALPRLFPQQHLQAGQCFSPQPCPAWGCGTEPPAAVS